MKTFLRTILFLALGLMLFPKASYATHCMGADIEYACTGVNASGQTMLTVTVVFYRDCGPAGAPASAAPLTITVNASSSCGTANCICTRTCPPTIPGLTACEVSPFCPAYYAQSCCHSNAPGCYPGVQKYTYTGTLTLPAACASWILSYEICCRNTSITNLTSPGSRSMRIEAMVNNLDTICSSSPVFTNSPVPYICDNQLYNYNHGAVDPDGDSLYYELVDPLNTGGVPCPFVAGFTATSPMSCIGPFGFNNFTGQMTFTPNGTQFAVVALKILK